LGPPGEAGAGQTVSVRFRRKVSGRSSGRSLTSGVVSSEPTAANGASLSSAAIGRSDSSIGNGGCARTGPAAKPVARSAVTSIQPPVRAIPNIPLAIRPAVTIGTPRP
jgi:hypothetical protein